MSTNTGIEWTDATWNPIGGCSRVSPGCENCYAERQAIRQVNGAHNGLVRSTDRGPRWTGEVRLFEDRLNVPLRWKKPCRVFVNSMSDLFHEAIPDEWIDRVFATMAMTPRHTFQVLTKRADRMRAYLGSAATIGRFVDLTARITAGIAGVTVEHHHVDDGLTGLRLPNVWLGVSVEDQARADERIPFLLQTPAAVRFVSAEPLLGPVDLARINGATLDALRGHDFELIEPWPDNPPRLNWVIVGGESGAGARPFDLAWGRRIVSDCKAAGVACFVKQIGHRVIGEADSANRWILPGGSEWVPPIIGPSAGKRPAEAIGFVPWHPKGGDTAEWPEDLRVREFPS